MQRVLLAVLCVACGNVGIEAGSGAGAGAAVPVTTTVLVASDLPTAVEAAGVLVADATLDLRVETAGRVVAVGFEDGDAVREGQVLVRLDDGQARAAVAAARARLGLAEATADRVEALAAKDRVSAADVDAAMAERALAAAELDAAEEQLRRMQVRAPRAGRVGLRQVEVGAVVDPGTVLTTLVDADPLSADVAVPEGLVGEVVVGRPATVWQPARPGARHAAEVVYVAPALDPATRLLGVRVALTGEGEGLAPGQTVRVALELAPAEGQLLVPSEAVTTRAEGPMVWVVQDGVAHARGVVLGARRAEQVAVREGLSAGEELVVQGIGRLREGAAVRTASAPAASR
ncbi:MAG: efflux RND transporter periplasmic adaptor subunit [Alphaproteobacteria bacterium]|nr:efflux RND transporter periplasmic adaptor subunit [Alphaproteobacteria bacterium]